MLMVFTRTSFTGANNCNSHTQEWRKIYCKNLQGKGYQPIILPGLKFFVKQFVCYVIIILYLLFLQLKLFFTEVTLAKPKSSRNSSIGDFHFLL